jgi:ribonuclease HII
MRYPNRSAERRYAGRVAGIDEAGRGPWAGPVVAAIVILPDGRIPSGIDDSKKLTRAAREVLYGRIMECAEVGIGLCNPCEIDRHNILQATFLAMRRAFDALASKPDVALVDGNRLPNLPCPMEAIIGGDAVSLSIAGASIIAKVTRDRIMKDLALIHPYYGWERNAGYGTREHQDGLARHGVTEHHRRSFAPIRALLEQAA